METASYNQDMTLRAAGFRIWSRNGLQEPRWIDSDGVVYRESEALHYAQLALGVYEQALPKYEKTRKGRKSV